MEVVIDNNEGVKSHQSTYVQMQRPAVSFNFAWLWESPQSIEKREYFPPSCCNQCTQANNVQRSVAELDKPCTRPAQCTNEKQQARALIRTQGHSNSLQQWERTVSRRTVGRAASAKNPRRPRTSQKPQLLHWPLRVLL